jgi:transcriptional regulator with XRE-family HTH domain
MNLMPKGARRRPARLAEKLRHLRYRLELTQEELKERIEQLGFVSDLDRADLSDFERGRRDPDLLTLLSYAYLTNVYLDVLVDDGLDLPEDLPSPQKHEGAKHVEYDKKTNAQGGAARSATVGLRLEIKGKTKLVRSANRVRANIERYHLRRYGMRRLKEGSYKLTLPCKSEADLKKRIRLLLEEIENEAARDDCVVEAEVLERDDNRLGD